MPGQDESTTVGIGVAIGVAVIFAVLFVLGLLCGLLSLATNIIPVEGAGHEAVLHTARLLLG